MTLIWDIYGQFLRNPEGRADGFYWGVLLKSTFWPILKHHPPLEISQCFGQYLKESRPASKQDIETVQLVIRGHGGHMSSNNCFHITKPQFLPLQCACNIYPIGKSWGLNEMICKMFISKCQVNISSYFSAGNFSHFS